MIHYISGYPHDSDYPVFRCDLKIQLEQLMVLMGWPDEEECGFCHVLTPAQIVSIENFEGISLPHELELHLICEES